MAMNSSGPISLGGATTGQSINLEVGAPATSTVSLNDVIVRQLAGVVSGQIVVPTDFYGKSLANAWFALYQWSSPTLSYLQQIPQFDSDSNFYFVNSVLPAGSGGMLTKVSGDDGSISYTNVYSFSPGAPANALRFVKQSNYDPTKLLAAFQQAETTPAPSSGQIVAYINKSNGIVSSISPVRFFGITPTQIVGFSGFNNAIDAPNGNILISYTNPPGAGTNLVLNSSFNVIQQCAISGVSPATAPRAIPSTSSQIYSGNTIDWSYYTSIGASPQPSGHFQTGFYDMSSLSFSSVTVRSGLNQNIGQNPATVTPNSKYFLGAQSVPGTIPGVSRSIWKIDRATQNVSIVRTLPATGQFTSGSIGSNANPSGDIIMQTVTGGLRLRRWDSSLNNTATWDVSGSTGVAFSAPVGTFANGYLYLFVTFTATSPPSRYWILKIKDDFSTIASGLTVTVGGYTITFTPNNAANITSFDAPYTVANPAIGTLGGGGYTTRAGMSVPASPDSSFLTVTKTTV